MASDKRQTRLAEFLGLVSFGLALLILISLATYRPTDPAPFFKAGASGPARNFIGPIGAFVAELLIPQLFGMAAMLLPLVLGITGWKLFWCRPIDAPYTKVAGLVLLLLSLTAFLALAFGTVQVEGETVRAGGAAGALLSELLKASFGRTGAFILVATSLFVSLILATQFSFAAFLTAVGQVLARRAQALRTAWAHFSETRRKEKMRQEVLRKHSQKDKDPAADAVPRVRKARMAPAGSEGVEEEDDEELEDLPLQAAPVVRGPAAKAAPVPARPLSLPFVADDEEDDESEREASPRRKKRAAVPAARSGDYTLPPTSILEELESEGRADRTRLFERAKVLQSKAAEFGVLGAVTEIHPGPVVTTYEFKPDAGIKYSKVVGLADDLALAMEAESIRIDRMSGRGTVGIEIPNEVRETISLREILESDTFRKATSRLTIALGKTVGGDTYVTDLAGMPHLLIAGATGQGKSVGLNCMISSILYKATPDEVRLILVDPKRLELGVYEDIPHLLTPVVTDPKVASNVLKWTVGEMEKRIRKLASEGVRNIEQYNNIIRAEKGTPPEPGEEPLKPLHYIVVIIDELADLMMVSSHEVEESITRLAQMARAVGIHLILATQRPSVDVLTGLIKANFPSRISFKVSARVDSRTILDSIGAEHLLGKGDMLFVPPGSARLTRIHGAFVSEKEIARLTEFLRTTGRPSYDDTVGKPERQSAEAEVEDKDELFDEAVRFVVQSGQASTSMLQRRFRIGFSRAGRLIDVMEQDGIIGPAEGSKSREILVPADYYEQVDTWPK
ncbi:MAG TPA: DNA translocase FtsK [Vicinamibacteria bacterium]|nr:DNA translocase FtsK [Vicinamibacteria bacterium]